MGNTNESTRFSGSPIYTLAQRGTNDNRQYSNKPNIVVLGEGTSLDDKAPLKRKARRKLLSQKLALSLVTAVENKGEPERTKSYWNAYYCQKKLFNKDGRLYGQYCKTRYCTICLAIRKAEKINKYYPVLKEWEDPYFVTLTVKAVKERGLQKRIDAMYRAFRQIKDKYIKRHQRGKDKMLVGIRSLECNYNPVDKTYNPHWHIIVPNRDMAVTLIVEWLRKWGKRYTSPMAQHKRKVKNLEKDLIEVIKYGSKIFTEPDMVKKSKDKIPPIIYAAALDNIFCAMRGKRLFDRFGFDLPKVDHDNKGKSKIIVDYEEVVFDASLSDWVNEGTGELVSGFVAEPQLLHLLGNNIDMETT